MIQSEERYEYRLVVRLGKDLPGGQKAGEDFVPFLEPRHDAWGFYPAWQWWRTAGHEPRYERRKVTTTYTDWEEGAA